MLKFLSYFHWDPHPEIFPIDLPFLHRGILWYGFFFGMGFLFGYWVLLYLTRRHFLFFPQLQAKDILSYSEWIRTCKKFPPSSPLFALFKNLSPSMQTQCLKWQVGMQLSEQVKQEIVKSCNAFLQDSGDCKELHSRFHQRLLAFAKGGREKRLAIKKRLYLEESLSCICSIKKRSLFFVDKATFYIVLGTLIGARVGDLVFYQGYDEIARDPLTIFKIWEGGLASHGGALGVLIALWLLSKKLTMPFLQIVDLIALPAVLVGGFIRIGNFFNQEIVGIPTQLPWGVIFGHPVAVEAGIPRHPVQLYEALWYFSVFFFLFLYFRAHPRLERRGHLAGWFFILVFVFRFFIEYLKVEQSRLLDSHAFLTMGQWLSLPAIAFGAYLLLRNSAYTKRRRSK